MKSVRPMVFEMRSAVPVAAGCLIANAMRETLTSLLGRATEVRLFEPVAPSREGWSAIGRDALLYRVAGSAGDAAIVLPRADALRFATAAFGEPASAERCLSPAEQLVVDRIVRAIAPALTAVCGSRSDALVAEPLEDLSGFTTYVEVQVERPLAARIGIAFSARAATSSPGPSLLEDALLDVDVEVSVRSEGVPVAASALAIMEVGTIVPITLKSGLTAVASVAGSPIARGECGVRGNRLALAIGLAPCTEGGSEPDHDR